MGIYGGQWTVRKERLVQVGRKAPQDREGIKRWTQVKNQSKRWLEKIIITKPPESPRDPRTGIELDFSGHKGRRTLFGVDTCMSSLTPLSLTLQVQSVSTSLSVTESTQNPTISHHLLCYHASPRATASSRLDYIKNLNFPVSFSHAPLPALVYSPHSSQSGKLLTDRTVTCLLSVSPQKKVSSMKARSSIFGHCYISRDQHNAKLYVVGTKLILLNELHK